MLAFRRQTVLTILEIWTGGRLPDGAALSLPGAAESGAELPGEEYPPINGERGQSSPTPPAPGTTEQWGGSGDQGGGAPAASGGLQERNL